MNKYIPSKNNLLILVITILISYFAIIINHNLNQITSFISIYLFLSLTFIYINNQIISNNEYLNFFEKDTLTGLNNKNNFLKLINEEINKNNKFYLIISDVEDFKRINQMNGYEYGDFILKNYAINLKLKKIIKYPSRISCDVFSFIINNEDLNIEAIHKYLNLLKSEVYEINNELYSIKQRFALIEYNNNVEYNTAEKLLCYAEITMAYNKEKNIYYQAYDNKLISNINYKNNIKKEIYSAFDNNEFYIVYQPKVNILNNDKYAEVLIRWSNQTLGNVYPDVFIEIAEQYGYINKIGLFVIEESFKFLKENKDVNLSINLSPKTIIK